MVQASWIIPGPGDMTTTPFERWLSGIRTRYFDLHRLYSRIVQAKIEGNIDLTAVQRTALRTSVDDMMTELRALVASDPT